MQIYDIPVNIKVSAESEAQAEDIVSHMMKQATEKPALLRQVVEWDFIIFAFEEDGSGTNTEGV